MSSQIRQTAHDRDCDRVGDFLIEEFELNDNLRLWIQPRWEYTYFHPLIKETKII